jgi:hypothetical protein
MNGEHCDPPSRFWCFYALSGGASRARESRDAPKKRYYPDVIDRRNLPG